MLLLDTHTWIWTVEGDTRRIGRRARQLSAAVAIDAGHIPRTALADPRDRLLVATARQLDATLLTGDAAIPGYALRTRNVRVRDLR